MKSLSAEIPVVTPSGTFTARYSEKGLAELNFPKKDRKKNQVNSQSANRIPQLKKWHRLTESALKKVLTGKKAKLPPLDWNGATDFQKSVWREMLKIAPGKTKSYGEIANAIRNPKAVRAVGGACGANPIPVLVPCHRILAANKKIGGFSGGLDWKRKLLTTEGVLL
ncbi:MAG TPA: MGMT family protein [Verrucomicrobiae bacterium]|nr:MGMT family protein [Verrucomicrobiae bacterium]